MVCSCGCQYFAWSGVAFYRTIKSHSTQLWECLKCRERYILEDDKYHPLESWLEYQENPKEVRE